MVDREHGQACLVRGLGRHGTVCPYFFFLVLFLSASSICPSYGFRIFYLLVYLSFVLTWVDLRMALSIQTFLSSPFGLPLYLHFIFCGAAPTFVFCALPVSLRPHPSVRTIDPYTLHSYFYSPVVGAGVPRRRPQPAGPCYEHVISGRKNM